MYIHTRHLCIIDKHIHITYIYIHDVGMIEIREVFKHTYINMRITCLVWGGYN